MDSIELGKQSPENDRGQGRPSGGIAMRPSGGGCRTMAFQLSEPCMHDHG